MQAYACSKSLGISIYNYASPRASASAWWFRFYFKGLSLSSERYWRSYAVCREGSLICTLAWETICAI